MDKDNLLPDGIVNLEYSERHRLFHFADNCLKYPLWVFLKAVSIEDAITFTSFMDKKYVNGRNSGRLPELPIVRLELDLFFELKHNRRKLAGR